jgi:hypothetical protein
MARITVTLHEDQCAFIISSWIFLRLRNDSNKSGREKSKQTFYFQ